MAMTRGLREKNIVARGVADEKHAVRNYLQLLLGDDDDDDGQRKRVCVV